MAHKWEIHWAARDPVVGSEQGRTRPVLTISADAMNDILPVVNALPLTSRKAGRRVYPNEALLPPGTGGLASESLVLCYQIRTLDKRRLVGLLGRVEDEVLRPEVVTALAFQLGG